MIINYVYAYNDKYVAHKERVEKLFKHLGKQLILVDTTIENAFPETIKGVPYFVCTTDTLKVVGELNGTRPNHTIETLVNSIESTYLGVEN